MSKNGAALRSGIWYTISDFLLRAIGLITTPIFTRILTREDFGRFSNFQSWQLILTIFISFNLVATLISAKYDYEKEFDQFILSLSCFTIFSSGFFLLVFNTFRNVAENLLKLNIEYINIMIFYILFSTIFGLFQAREKYLYRYKSSVVFSLINAFASVLCSLLLVIVWENKLWGRVVGMVIPTIILGFGIFLFFVRKGHKPSVKHLKYALPICLPYIPHALSLMVLSAMDKIQITTICGAEDTALYSVAYTCGSAVTLFMSSMNEAFAPWLGDHLGAKDYKPITEMSKYYIGFFFYGAIGVMLLTPELLLVVGGKSYESARFVMAPVSLGIIFQFLYTMFVNIEQFEKNTKPMALATMAAALFNFVTNVVFINLFGYIAAAYTTAASYFVLLLLHMLIVYKMNMLKIYDYKLIVLICIIGVIITSIMSVLYMNNILRYIIVMLYCAMIVYMVIRYQDKICHIFKMMKKE